MSSFLFALGFLSVGITESPGGDPPIGALIADFRLANSQGEVRHLSDWSGGRIVCVAFLKVGCPVAELYANPLAEIAERFGPQGVAFLGVMTDGDQDPAVLEHYAAEHGIGFPLLEDGEASSRLGASRTPEVVVLDARRRVRYRGRIDDRYAVGSRRNTARSHDLVDALEDLLAGREVARTLAQASGCPIERLAAPVVEAGVTYHRDIAPILDRRCVSCHRPGQIGPFSLRTYREVVDRAGAIAEAVEERRMPPWHADPRFGKFANDARLTDRERELILDWDRQGSPEGDPADLSTPIDRPNDWRIPQPDLIISMPEPYHVPAQGVVDYQTFEVDPGFTEDRWIRGAEVRPGNRKVVHHCNVFLKAPRSRSDVDPQGDLESYCLAVTTPGSPPLELPRGMAKRIPAGWRFVFVVHYSPIGTPQVDRTSIGLLFADPASVKQEVATNLIFDPDLRIPPGEANYRVERGRRFDSAVLLLSMFPHMHLRGKSFRFEAPLSRRPAETLLDVPHYDFNWQNRYELAEPRLLPAGTILRCIAHYDNSVANPANPDPTATVLTGPQSWDEMFNGYYDIALADQDLSRPSTWFETFAGTSGRSSAGLAAIACAAFLATWLLIRRSLTAFAWLVGFGFCSLPVFLGILNHDVAWMLLAAERALDGQRLYVDVIEVNPPLIIWLSLAPVLLARTLVISPILAFRLIMLAVLAGSLLVSSRVLALEHPDSPRTRRPILILAMLALLPLVGNDFGQREHLMLGLFLPYLLLASVRAEGRPVRRSMAWVVGLAAGVGIALKPQFVPLWIAIEAYLVWERGDRLAWLRPEALAVAAVGLAYGVAVVGINPEYLDMARWALPLYARCAPAPFSEMLVEPSTMLMAVATLGSLALQPRAEHRQVCRLLLVAGLSLLAIAFLQDKGYTYHFYPAMASGTMLLGLLALGRPDSEHPVRRSCLLMTRVVLALLVLGVSTGRVVDSLCWRGNPGESDTTVGRLIKLARARAHDGSVFTFSPAVAASFPMVTYGEVGWASRYPCLFFLPGFHPDGLPTREEMGQTERSLRASVVDDLIREKPALLFVDETESKPAFRGGRFDFLDYYSADPRFVEFLRDYVRITEIDQFGVYQRQVSKGSSPTTSDRY